MRKLHLINVTLKKNIISRDGENSKGKIHNVKIILNLHVSKFIIHQPVVKKNKNSLVLYEVGYIFSKLFVNLEDLQC